MVEVSLPLNQISTTFLCSKIFFWVFCILFHDGNKEKQTDLVTLYFSDFYVIKSVESCFTL